MPGRRVCQDNAAQMQTFRGNAAVVTPNEIGGGKSDSAGK